MGRASGRSTRGRALNLAAPGLPSAGDERGGESKAAWRRAGKGVGLLEPDTVELATLSRLFGLPMMRATDGEVRG